MASVASLSKLILSAAGLRESLSSQLLALLANIWGGFDDWFDDDGVERAAQLAVDAEMSVLRQLWAAGDSAARAMLAQAGVQVPADGSGLPGHPRGVDLVELWSRPAEQYRYAVSVGDTPEDALLAAFERAFHIADMDAALVSRDAQVARFRSSEKVIGYRRMIHPELANSGMSCGLCVAASTRTYSVDDLAPLHNGCNCSVAPITKSNDPGLELSRADLNRLYAAGGSTSKQDLARVRVSTVEHGELGPLLVHSGQKYLSEDEARARVSRKNHSDSAGDPNSLKAIRNKVNRTPEESKRLHALAQSNQSRYEDKLNELLRGGMDRNDPRVLGMRVAVAREEKNVKKYAGEMAA